MRGHSFCLSLAVDRNCARRRMQENGATGCSIGEAKPNDVYDNLKRATHVVRHLMQNPQ